MIREALKDALLDLKSQLRGRKASTYVLKIEEAAGDAKSAKKPNSEDDDDKNKPKRSGAGKASEAVSEGMDSLRQEMKEFMNKKKPGTGGRPIMPLPINPSSKASKQAPAPDLKPKGKAK